MKTKAEGPTLRALIGCGLAEGNSTFFPYLWTIK